MITRSNACANRQHLMPREIDIARQRLVLDVLSARRSLMLAPPTAPAMDRLELVRKLVATRNALIKHTNK